MKTAHKLLLKLVGGGAATFTPSSITGLQRWYQRPTGAIFGVEDGTGAVAGGGAVGYWTDQSSNAAPAKQATAGDRPLYRTADAVLGDCIDFVSSDLLKWDSALALQDFTAVFEVVFDVWTLNEPRPLMGNSGSNSPYIYLADTSGNSAAEAFRVSTVSGSYNLVLASELATGTRYVLAVRRSGVAANNITFYVNGVSVGQASGNGVLTVDQLGARGAKVSVLDGKMRAALIWDVAITDVQLASVHTFLAG
jgi:hypothetical protein